jgi:hypothetical protein
MTNIDEDEMKSCLKLLAKCTMKVIMMTRIKSKNINERPEFNYAQLALLTEATKSL